MAGRYRATKGLRDRVISHAEGETLGHIKDRKRLKRIASAYYKQDEAAEHIETYSWAIPTAPAPFVGYACRPGRYSTATVNSSQFRSDREFDLSKPSDTLRVFIVGGSVALSCGAPSQDRTIAAYMERAFRRERSRLPQGKSVEVWTMAAPAWSSTHERIIIVNRLSALSPDLVVCISGYNDVHWGMAGYDIQWFRSYEDSYYWALLRETYQLSRARELPNIVHQQDSPVDASVVAQRLEKNVRVALFVLQSEGARLLYCLQPKSFVAEETGRAGLRYVTRSVYFKECYGEISSRLGSVASQGFSYLDLGDFFRDKAATSIFLDSCHMGDRGNDLLSQKIVEYILDTGLLKSACPLPTER